MVVDEKVFKFSMRDGWNEADIETIVQYWCIIMTHGKFKQVLLLNNK